jgi:hypothetical protein
MVVNRGGDTTWKEDLRRSEQGKPLIRAQIPGSEKRREPTERSNHKVCFEAPQPTLFAGFPATVGRRKPNPWNQLAVTHSLVLGRRAAVVCQGRLPVVTPDGTLRGENRVWREGRIQVTRKERRVPRNLVRAGWREATRARWTKASATQRQRFPGCID